MREHINEHRSSKLIQLIKQCRLKGMMYELRCSFRLRGSVSLKFLRCDIQADSALVQFLQCREIADSKYFRLEEAFKFANLSCSLYVHEPPPLCPPITWPQHMISRAEKEIREGRGGREEGGVRSRDREIEGDRGRCWIPPPLWQWLWGEGHPE